ncbi:prokineticin-2 [Biomphalaria glabrata]|nr:prokineticin-2 [Biomphalaria glabrata]
MSTLYFMCFLLCIHQVIGAAYQHCRQATECARNECCLLDKSTKKGVCRPMGGVAARCYVSQPYVWTRPVAMITNYDLCPCEPGNICGAIDSFDSVYRQKGICSFGK